MTKHLLVFGDDGSPEADVAWGWIVSQRWPGWTVRAIGASPPPGGAGAGGRALTGPSEPAFPHDVPHASGIEVLESSPLVGDPGSALIGAGAALIVIGSRHPDGSGRLGATTDHLIGHIGPPLVLAKRSGPIRRVLVAVDGSRDALAAASALAWMPWIADIDAAEVLGVHDERRHVERGIEEGLGVLLEAGVPTHRASAGGAVTDAILAEAESFGADLVALGVRGLNLLHRLGIGSTAKAIAYSSPTSVLLAAHDRAES